MSTDQLREQDWAIIDAAIARIRASVMAVVFGMVGGTGVLVATLWLVVRGGEQVGPHLDLLGNYFFGYSVTWTGSLVGFGYGALVGAAVGWSVAWIYNRVADQRAKR
jgi:hypothetical protein